MWRECAPMIYQVPKFSEQIENSRMIVWDGRQLG